MKLRFVVGSALTMLLTMSSGCRESETNDTPRPNIVIIYADDVGYGDLSSYGAENVHTPISTGSRRMGCDLLTPTRPQPRARRADTRF